MAGSNSETHAVSSDIQRNIRRSTRQRPMGRAACNMSGMTLSRTNWNAFDWHANILGQEKALNTGSGEGKNPPSDGQGADNGESWNKTSAWKRTNSVNRSTKMWNWSNSRSSAACDNASPAEVRVCSSITGWRFGAVMSSLLARRTKQSPWISTSTSFAAPSQRNNLVSERPALTVARRPSATWRHLELSAALRFPCGAPGFNEPIRFHGPVFFDE